MGNEEAEKAMDESCKAFYISLVEGRPGAMLSSVNHMKELVDKLKTSEDHPAWAEMVTECERKGGDACLNVVRSECKDGRERLRSSSARDDGGDDTQEEAQLRHDQLSGACFAAVGFGQKRGVISIYGGYLQALLKSQTDKSFSVLSKQRAVRRLNRVGVKSSEKSGADPHPHATAITEVLSFTCTVLDSHLLGEGLGSDVELAIAGPIHDDCCDKTTQILSWMHEDCSVDWWCEQAKNAEGGGCIKPNSGNLCGEPSSFDTQEIIMPTSLSCCFFDLDFVIDELSFVCQVIQRYFEFVEARDCLSMSSEASQGLFQSFHSSIGSYVRLEDSYCLLSVKEAVRIAEPIEIKKGVLVNSMVEDAAFLLLKSLERSVSTHSTQAIMATVNRIADILDPLAPQPSFFSGLQSESLHLTPSNAVEQLKYKENEKETFGEAFARALEEDVEGMGRAAADHINQSEIVIMNSSQAAVNAVTALKHAILQHLDGGNALTQTLIEQMRAAMRAYEELRDGYVKSFISRVYPRAAKTCQTSWMKSGGVLRYRMNADAYEAVVAAEDFPWVKSLMDAIEQGPLGVCRNVMMKETFECLLQALAREICDDIECFMLGTGKEPNSKCFTEWGALVLQREESNPRLKYVRMLQGRLVGMVEEGASPLTDSFERLNVLILILTVERPSDLQNYTYPPRVVSPTTARRSLVLREEFDPGAVYAMHLDGIFGSDSSEPPSHL